MFINYSVESDQNLWTILLTYSFVQGYLLAVYGWLTLRRYFLATLLAVISTLILAHLYYHFQWFRDQPHFIFTEAPLWYLIGPLIYLFMRNLFGYRTGWKSLLHLVPFLVFLAYIGPFYFEPGPEKISTLGAVFSENTYQGDINRALFSAHIFIYMLLTWLAFNQESTRLKESSSRSNLILDSGISLALKYYLIFFGLGLIVYLLAGQNYERAQIYYVVYYAGLSVLIHFIFYYILMRGGSQPEHVDNMQSVDKYSSSSLSPSELERIAEQVMAYVDQFEVYRNPELRLRMVSEGLNIPQHQISQAINQQLEKTFFDLVNERRIEGMRQHIGDKRYANYTLAGIASEHGFKSDSSFYRIVKKYTGMTPKDYFRS